MNCSVKRILISGVMSGSGKTTVTVTLLGLLLKKGLKVNAFKCGPDYIDPLFHEKVLSIPSGNLDPVFQDEELMRCIFGEKSRGSDIAVTEGVMGYYDGLSFGGAEMSSYECGKILKSPVILVINAKGMSYSLIAVLKGMKELKEDSNIRGVILNNIPESVYLGLKPVIERETGIRLLGYLPHVRGAEIESRHLGLFQPGETDDPEGKIKKLVDAGERSLDLPGILQISEEAGNLSYDENYREKLIKEAGIEDAGNIPVAIARDEAFSFIYEDNLDILKRCSVKPVFFSPLRDRELPKGIKGCIFFGGYPELYLKGLSENKSMLSSVRNALSSGLPCLAECGGYMYLHETIYDTGGEGYRVTSFFPGSEASFSGSLRHFGYVSLSTENDNPFVKKGESLKAHEFHYYDTTKEGGVMDIRKISGRGSAYRGMTLKSNTFAGFPHFYYYGNLPLIKNFLELCRRRDS